MKAESRGCNKCKAIEPRDNDVVFGWCDCKPESVGNLDGILKEIEDNFESLWEGVKE